MTEGRYKGIRRILRTTLAGVLSFIMAASPILPLFTPANLQEAVDKIGDSVVWKATSDALLAGLNGDVSGATEKLSRETVPAIHDLSASLFTKDVQKLGSWLGVGAPAASAAVSTDTMVAYWKFDETSAGTNAADSSGDGNAGTPNGTGGANNLPQPSTDVASGFDFTNARSLDFDGTDDYISGGVTGMPNIDGNQTMALWVKPDQITRRIALSRVKDDTSGALNSVDIEINVVSGFIAYRVVKWGGTALVNWNSSDNTTGIWRHITYTFDGTTHRLYVDGVERATSTTAPDTGTTGVVRIGSFNSAFPTPYWDGQLDDVRIYNRVLSATEISALAAGDHTAATWDGSSSTNYETAANWSTDAIPDPYTKVTVADVATQPILTANVALAGLTINSGATIDLDSFTLTFNDSGVFSNSGTLILDGTQALTGFTNDTDSGAIMVAGVANDTGLATGNSYNSLIINDGLMGYWKLDETSAPSADTSGYSNNGTWNGNTSASTNVPTLNFSNSRSADFDGAGDYVDIAALPITQVDNWTIAAWIYPRDTTTARQPSIYIGDADINGFGIAMSGNTAGRISVLYGGVAWNDTNTSYTINTWHHIVAVRSGGTMTLYSNGSALTPTFSGTPNTPTVGMRIAEDRSDNAEGNGLVDDVRIYNRALSETEIGRLAAGNQPETLAATQTLGAALDVNGDLTLNSGTLDTAAGSNFSINVAGSWMNNGGVFTPRSGTVTLDGTNQEINSSNTFYNLIKSVASAATLTFGVRSTQTISNTLTLNGAASQLLSLVSSAPGTAWKIDPQGTRTISYLDVKDSNNINATEIIANDGTNTNSGGNTNWDFTGGDDISGVVYTDEGSTNIGANKTVAVSINGAAAAATAETNASGAYSFSGLTVSSGDVITLYLDDETEDAVTVTKIGAADLTGIDLYQDRLITRSDNGVALTNANLDTANNNGDVDITGIYTNSGTSITVAAGKELFIPASNSYTPGATLTVGTGGMDVRGTFTQGSETITINGNFSQSSGTFAGGSGPIDINGTFTLSGGTFTSTSGTLTIKTNATISGGTFTHNSGTVQFGINQNLLIALDMGATIFNNVILNQGGGSASYTITGTLDVNGNLTITNATAINSGTIAVAGNVTTTDSTVVGTATILFDGGGNQTLGASGGTGGVPNVAINKSGGTLTIQDSINVWPSGSTSTWVYTAGTVDAGTSTVRFCADNCNDVYTVNSGSMSFYNVDMKMGGGSAVLNITGTMDVNGSFSITNGTTINGGAITIAGNLSSTDTSVAGTTAMTLDGTGTQNITMTGDGSSNGDLPNGIFTVNKASGTAILTTHATTAFNATGQDLTISSGTLDLAGFNLTVNDVFTLGAAGTLELFGSETVSALDANTGTIKFTGDDDDAADAYIITDKFTDYHHLTFNSADGATDTFQLGAGITVAGNWTNTAGTFDPNSQTVTLDGTHQTLAGTTSFYNLSKTESANDATDEVLTFPASATTTITNIWTLDGRDADDRINLVSSTPGTRANVSPTGTRTLDNIEVTDSNNTSGTIINEQADATVVDGGNNLNWLFSTTSAFTWTGATNSTWSTGSNWAGGVAPGTNDTAVFDGAVSSANATISSTVSVAGVDIQSDYTGTITQSGSNTLTVGASNYSQAGGTFTGGSGTITLNGNFTLSGGMFTSTSGTMTIGNNAAAGTWTHTAGGTFNHNNGTVQFGINTSSHCAAADVATSETFYNLTTISHESVLCTISSGDTLIVLNTFTQNRSRVYTGTIEARGNVVLTNATLGTATLSFLIAGDQTITSSGGSTMSFNINKPSGTVSLTGDLGIQSFTLSSGTFTSTSGTLTVVGIPGNAVWTHTAGGTFNHNNGTVQFGLDASSYCVNLDVSTSETFYNFIGKAWFGSPCIITSGDTIIVSNTFTHTEGVLNTGIIETKGNVLIASTADGGTATLTFTGTANQTYTDSGGNEPDGDITINKASGTVTLASNADWGATNQDFTLTAGTLDTAGFTLATKVLTVASGASVVSQGGETLTSTSFSFSGGANATYNGSGTYSSGLIWGDAYNNLTFNGSGAWTLDAALDVNGNLTFTAGTLDAHTTSNFGLTVGGSWADASNLFIERQGTVTFDGSGSSNTINEGGTFYNLIFNGSGTWDAASAITASNNLTLTAGTFDINGQNLTVTGTFSNNDTLRLRGSETVTATWDTDSGTTTYDGTILYASGLVAGDAYHNLTFNGSGGQWDMDATLDINNNLTISAGTLNLNGFDFTVAGNVSNNGTISNTEQRTLTLDGVTQALNLGGLTLGTLAVSGSSGTTTLGSSFSIGTLLTIATNKILALGSYVLTLVGNLTNSGAINENTGYVRKDATSFYIADSNFDEEGIVSLGSDRIYLSIMDEDGNLDGTAANTIANSVAVTCANGAFTDDSETVTLTETGNATEVFRYTAGILTALGDASVTTNDGTLECQNSETITATFTDPQDGADTEVDTTTATTDTIPTAPSNFAGAAASDTSITWTWTDNSSNETGFKLYDASNNLIATIATPNATSYTETGLTASTSYTRKVAAYNAAGNSSYSGTAAVTTDAAPTPTPAPAAGDSDSGDEPDCCPGPDEPVPTPTPTPRATTRSNPQPLTSPPLRSSSSAGQAELAVRPSSITQIIEQIARGETPTRTPQALQLDELAKQALRRRTQEGFNLITWLNQLFPDSWVTWFDTMIAQLFNTMRTVLAQWWSAASTRLASAFGFGADQLLALQTLLRGSAADIAYQQSLVADTLRAQAPGITDHWNIGSTWLARWRQALLAFAQDTRAFIWDTLKAGRRNRLALAQATENRLIAAGQPVRFAWSRGRLSALLAWDGLRGAYDKPLAITDVTIEELAGSRVVISWRTTRVTNGKVNWGESLSYGASERGGEAHTNDLDTFHRVEITKLTPNTRIYFEVVATDARSSSTADAYYSFVTPAD